MPADWVISVCVGLLLFFLTIFLTFMTSSIERKRQKALLQIQADKRGEQVNESLTLVLPMGDFRLLITPNLFNNNFQTWATLSGNGSDLPERVSHFPKIAVFRKQFLPSNSEKSQVRKIWKKFHLGKKEFDKAFSIYAENEAAVHRILTDEIRQGLLALSSKSPQVRTDRMIFLNFFATSKMIRDTNTYNVFIDTAIAISEKLTGSIYEPKQTAGHVTTQSDIASENFILMSLKDIKEIPMSFFKNLFSKKEGVEPFIPTPTQSIPGLEPIIVQAIENLFPDAEDQKKAIAYALEYKESKFGKSKGSTFRLLAMLANTDRKIEGLPDPNLWPDSLFNKCLYDTFPYEMKGAEEWVKSITKTQD